MAHRMTLDQLSLYIQLSLIRLYTIWTEKSNMSYVTYDIYDIPGIMVSRFACCHAIISNSFAFIFCIHSSEWRANSCSLWTWKTSLLSFQRSFVVYECRNPILYHITYVCLVVFQYLILFITREESLTPEIGFPLLKMEFPPRYELTQNYNQ